MSSVLTVGQLDSAVEAENRPLLIIEGSYCLEEDDPPTNFDPFCGYGVPRMAGVRKEVMKRSVDTQCLHLE